MAGCAAVRGTSITYTLHSSGDRRDGLRPRRGTGSAAVLRGCYCYTCYGFDATAVSVCRCSSRSSSKPATQESAMSDRYLLVLGNRLLCLPSDVFEAGLRAGAAVAGTIFEGDD